MISEPPPRSFVPPSISFSLSGFELKTSSKEKKIEKSTKRQKKEITRLQLAMASSKGEQFQNATKITRHQLAMASRRRAYSPWRMEGLARRVRAV
ncbi:hypothetical protein MTR_8g018743 [Medicago truncatula]|uniref:Uncharacterized protein n=1 Tax=Medicago truncatula TaxID=3880 RepID=A0A072TLQ8_MEDTR|nr:hypothetical protein MTR_8g018743 [Medicago truncatula]